MAAREEGIVLDVVIKCGRSLAARQYESSNVFSRRSRTTSSPFVRVFEGGREVFATSAVKKSLDPSWNEGFRLAMGAAGEARMEVWDHRSMGRNEYMGECNLVASQLPRACGTSQEEIWLPLARDPSKTKDVVSGELCVGVAIVEGDVSRAKSLKSSRSPLRVLNKAHVLRAHEEGMDAYDLSLELGRVATTIKRAALEWTSRELLEPSFRELERLSGSLQRCTLAFVTPDFELAFWCNVYHALHLHSVLFAGAFSPFDAHGHADAASPYHCCVYIVGGFTLSCAQIAHGILGNRPSPLPPHGPVFGEGDPRGLLAMRGLSQTQTQQLLFVLDLHLCSPPMSDVAAHVFEAANMRTQLHRLTASYLSKTVTASVSKRKVKVPHVFNDYIGEFGGQVAGVVRFCAAHLPQGRARDKMVKVAAEGADAMLVKYTHPEWSCALPASLRGSLPAAWAVDHAELDRLLAEDACALPLALLGATRAASRRSPRLVPDASSFSALVEHAAAASLLGAWMRARERERVVRAAAAPAVERYARSVLGVLGGAKAAADGVAGASGAAATCVIELARAWDGHEAGMALVGAYARVAVSVAAASPAAAAADPLGGDGAGLSDDLRKISSSRSSRSSHSGSNEPPPSRVRGAPPLQWRRETLAALRGALTSLVALEGGAAGADAGATLADVVAVPSELSMSRLAVLQEADLVAARSARSLRRCVLATVRSLLHALHGAGPCMVPLSAHLLQAARALVKHSRAEQVVAPSFLMHTLCAAFAQSVLAPRSGTEAQASTASARDAFGGSQSVSALLRTAAHADGAPAAGRGTAAEQQRQQLAQDAEGLRIVDEVVRAAVAGALLEGGAAPGSARSRRPSREATTAEGAPEAWDRDVGLLSAQVADAVSEALTLAAEDLLEAASAYTDTLKAAIRARAGETGLDEASDGSGSPRGQRGDGVHPPATGSSSASASASASGETEGGRNVEGEEEGEEGGLTEQEEWAADSARELEWLDREVAPGYPRAREVLEAIYALTQLHLPGVLASPQLGPDRLPDDVGSGGEGDGEAEEAEGDKEAEEAGLDQEVGRRDQGPTSGAAAPSPTARGGPSLGSASSTSSISSLSASTRSPRASQAPSNGVQPRLAAQGSARSLDADTVGRSSSSGSVLDVAARAASRPESGEAGAASPANAASESAASAGKQKDEEGRAPGEGEGGGQVVAGGGKADRPRSFSDTPPSSVPPRAATTTVGAVGGVGAVGANAALTPGALARLKGHLARMSSTEVHGLPGHPTGQRQWYERSSLSVPLRWRIIAVIEWPGRVSAAAEEDGDASCSHAPSQSALAMLAQVTPEGKNPAEGLAWGGDTDNESDEEGGGDSVRGSSGDGEAMNTLSPLAQLPPSMGSRPAAGDEAGRTAAEAARRGRRRFNFLRAGAAAQGTDGAAGAAAVGEDGSERPLSRRLAQFASWRAPAAVASGGGGGDGDAAEADAWGRWHGWIRLGGEALTMELALLAGEHVRQRREEVTWVVRDAANCLITDGAWEEAGGDVAGGDVVARRRRRIRRLSMASAVMVESRRAPQDADGPRRRGQRVGSQGSADDGSRALKRIPTGSATDLAAAMAASGGSGAAGAHSNDLNVQGVIHLTNFRIVFTAYAAAATVLPASLQVFEVPLCAVERVDVSGDAEVSVDAKDMRQLLLRVAPPFATDPTMHVLAASALDADAPDAEGSMSREERVGVLADSAEWASRFVDAVRQFAFGDPAKQFARAHRSALQGLLKNAVPFPPDTPGSRVHSVRRPGQQGHLGHGGATGAFSALFAGGAAERGESTAIPGSPSAVSVAVDGWRLFDFVREFHRQGILDSTGSAKDGWRVYRNAYVLSESYPFDFIVPTGITDQELRQVAKFRSRGRIPAVTWVHPAHRCVLARSSQPRTGLSARRCPADEKLLAIYGSRGLSDTFQIMDARHVMAAVGNKMKGKGVESADHYRNTRITFLNIGNIHTMRESLARLHQAAGQGAGSDKWQARLDFTGWLRHVQLVMSGSERVARALHSDGASVLLHCSDGWDRTAQLSATVQILLDPYFRTLEGFCVLVEKDWCAFGHKFADRLGHGSAHRGDSERSPIFLQWLDVVWQVLRQRPAAFQFNQRLLLFVAHSSFSCRFGTFLYNTAAEREREKLPQTTVSIWTHVLSPEGRAAFTNAQYRRLDAPLWISTNPRRVVLWEALHLRWTPENWPLQSPRRSAEPSGTDAALGLDPEEALAEAPALLSVTTM